VDSRLERLMTDDEPGLVRLRWPGGGTAAMTSLVVRHHARALSGNELRMLAEIVDAIENFRDEVADPEGIGA
jgi:hypothetical protein